METLFLDNSEEQLKKADIEYVLFDKVRPNPTAQNVMDGAKLAREKQFDFFTTTLSISPLKRADKLNEIGLQLQQEYEVPYLFSDFKKKNGYLTSIRLSKEYNLYRQDYCGCVYSKLQREREKQKKEKEQLEE